MKHNDQRITPRSIVWGAIFAALFAQLTVFFAHRRAIYVTAVQIPVLPYVLLLLSVLLINPLCRLIRIVRRFSVAEILVVFLMGLVSSGVSTFGLTDQLVPVIGSLFNRHWNNDQTEWNRYVEPFMNERYFLSAPRLQDAARGYRDALQEAERIQSVYDLAVQYSQAQANLSRARKAVDDLSAASVPDSPQSALRVSTARKELDGASRAMQAAGDAWAGGAPPDAPRNSEDAARVYLARLQDVRRDADARRQELRRLEEDAFAKVEEFRRGLSKDKRAFPGVLPLPEDDPASYLARFRRLVAGRKAMGIVAGIAAGTPAEGTLAPDAAAALAAEAAAAAAVLQPSADPSTFVIQRDAKALELKALSNRIIAQTDEIRRMNEAKRAASGDEILRMQRRVASMERSLKRLRRDESDLTLERESIERQIEVTTHVQALIADVSALQAALTDPAPPASAIASRIRAIQDRFPSIDASFTRYFAGDVPWRNWAGPLLRWSLLIALTYIMLLAFNVLIFRQWAYNEKLIYPLAELPEILAGHNDAEQGAVPSVFRTGLFWTGFAVSGCVLGWNLLSASAVIPGLKPLVLEGKWTPYILNTAFQGLIPSAKSAVFFTMIGLSFLIPKKVSFSLWFFAVLYMIQLLILVGLSYGVNERSFPEEWWYTLNFRTAEGGGALIVFASVVLYKCRRYIFCAFSPSAVRGLERDEQIELRTASVLFLLASIGIVLILWRGMGANLPHTLFAFFIIIVITIGLVRAVAEGGILGFQAWVSPFHFTRSIVGMNKTWSAPSLFAPLMVYYSILFLDIKTFIAPSMANSLKIRDDLRLSRARFHLLILLAIAIASAVALASAIMMCYSRGADAMSSWFYTSFPQGLFDKIATMAKTPPQPSASDTGWILAGGLAMAALLYFRQSLFWLPHPIGMIMLVNPIMRYYWFSIFIGWVAKAVVTRYGSKDAYLRVRCLFIGLIVGELIVVTLSMIVSSALGMSIGIDLNRN